MRPDQKIMNRQLISQYPGISFDHSYANYATYLQFTDKQQNESSGLASLLPRWLGHHRTRLRALDVGAGNGRLAQTIHDLYATITDDYSLTLLEPASIAADTLVERFSQDKRVAVIAQSLQEMIEESPEPFDFVLASHVSYYFEDRDAFFNTLCDLLAPDGVLCLISGSISLLDHPFYSELMPAVLDFGAGKRSFDLVGYGSCAEELQLIGFNNGRILSTTRVPASMSFTNAQLKSAINALKNWETCQANNLCRSLGFLWRTSIETVFEKREMIAGFFERQLTKKGGMTLPCEDHIMFLKMPGQPGQGRPA